MLKSKISKEKRTQEKEENEEVIDKLDAEMKDLMPLLERKKTRAERMMAQLEGQDLPDIHASTLLEVS